jgi:hypothetical protein
MNGPIAKFNKIFFFEQLSMSYIREIWFPNREHSKVFKAIIVLSLRNIPLFVSIMLNLSIEGNLILHTKRTRSPCSTTDIEQSLNVNKNGHLDHQTYAIFNKIFSALSQST